VDTQEPRDFVALFALEGIPVKVKDLSVDLDGQVVGFDFTNTDGTFRAERKVAFRDDAAGPYSDLYESLVDGRLMKQLRAAAAYGGHRALILEGDLSRLLSWKHAKAGWIRSVIEDASMRYGWHVYHTKDMTGTVKMVERLERKVSPGDIELPAVVVRSKDPRLGLLQSIPLLGEKKSLKVFKSIDSIAELATMEREDLESKFGKGTGGWIHDVFHVPTSRYLKRTSR
jgi:ERCC4-type nuclease